MHTIRRIDVYSMAVTFGYISMVLFAAIGLVRLFTFTFLGSLPTFPVFYSTGTPAEMGVGIAIINYLIGIVFALGNGGFAGAVVALIYNLLAPYFGGMRIQID